MGTFAVSALFLAFGFLVGLGLFLVVFGTAGLRKHGAPLVGGNSGRGSVAVLSLNAFWVILGLAMVAKGLATCFVVLRG